MFTELVSFWGFDIGFWLILIKNAFCILFLLSWNSILTMEKFSCSTASDQLQFSCNSAAVQLQLSFHPKPYKAVLVG